MILLDGLAYESLGEHRLFSPGVWRRPRESGAPTSTRMSTALSFAALGGAPMVITINISLACPIDTKLPGKTFIPFRIRFSDNNDKIAN